MQELVDMVVEELVTAAHLEKDSASGGTMEKRKNLVADEADAQGVAEALAYGYPSRRDDPTGIRSPGRFAKSFPLLFPMGIADMFEDRPRDVSPAEYVQHLFLCHRLGAPMAIGCAGLFSTQFLCLRQVGRASLCISR